MPLSAASSRWSPQRWRTARGPAQGVPRRRLPLGVHRPHAERLAALVRHARVRQPRRRRGPSGRVTDRRAAVTRARTARAGWSRWRLRRIGRRRARPQIVERCAASVLGRCCDGPRTNGAPHAPCRRLSPLRRPRSVAASFAPAATTAGSRRGERSSRTERTATCADRRRTSRRARCPRTGDAPMALRERRHRRRRRRGARARRVRTRRRPRRCGRRAEVRRTGRRDDCEDTVARLLDGCSERVAAQVAVVVGRHRDDVDVHHRGRAAIDEGA